MQILTFRSPVIMKGYLMGEDEFRVLDYNESRLLEGVVRSSLEEDIDNPRFGKGLARYLWDDLDKRIISITLDIISLNGAFITETVCVVKDNLNDDEIETLREWIHGQFSDGFGEGFEQRDILEGKTIDFDFNYDEVYVELWDNFNWDLKLVNKYEF